MRKIKVYVERELHIPNTARLVGMPENEVRRLFHQAERDGVICMFETYVTETQWENIQKHKGRRRRTDNGG
jgi:DNA-binding Lrp family transcriptional regulator